MTAAEIRAWRLLNRLCKEAHFPQLVPLKAWVDKRRKAETKPVPQERPAA